MSRPTDLHFRSPKQKTPEYYNTRVTKEGNKANIIQPSNQAPTSFEKTGNFSSSQKRFFQYDQWAKTTSIFLGPGVYNDHHTFIRLNKQPCAVKYKLSQLGKEQGKDCFIMIGDHSMMYEPAFEKLEDKYKQQVVTNEDRPKVPLNSVFAQSNLNFFKNSRNGRQSMGVPATSNQRTFYPKPQIRKASQSFYNDIKDINNNRPQTSYSGSRAFGSTQAQSRNQARSLYSGGTSHFDMNGPGGGYMQNQSFLQDSLRSQNMTSGLQPSSTKKADSEMFYVGNGTSLLGQQQNQLQGFEIKRINSAEDRQQTGYPPCQPKDNPNLQEGSDRLMYDNQLPQIQLMAQTEGSERRPRTANTLGRKRGSRKQQFQQQIVDIKKSVSLLQAYGEYDRFMQVSKKYMRDNGIVVKKQSKKKKRKSTIDRNQITGATEVTTAGEGGRATTTGVEGDSTVVMNVVDGGGFTDHTRGESVGEDNYREIDKILDEKLEKFSNPTEL